MLALTPSLKTVVALSLGALAIAACDDMAQLDVGFVPDDAAALHEARLAPKNEVNWTVAVELERASTLSIQVPVVLDAVERDVPCPGGTLELALFDARTDRQLAVAFVADAGLPLTVDVADPCDGDASCSRVFRVHARWVGADSVLVNPDVEVASDGRVRFAE